MTERLRLSAQAGGGGGRSWEVWRSYLASSSPSSASLCLASSARSSRCASTFSLSTSSRLCAWNSVFMKKTHTLLSPALSLSFSSSLGFSFFSGRKFNLSEPSPNSAVTRESLSAFWFCPFAGRLAGAPSPAMGRCVCPLWLARARRCGPLRLTAWREVAASLQPPGPSLSFFSESLKYFGCLALKF